MELFRNGSLQTVIATDDQYVYDKSPIHNHMTPIEVQAGKCNKRFTLQRGITMVKPRMCKKNVVLSLSFDMKSPILFSSPNCCEFRQLKTVLICTGDEVRLSCTFNSRDGERKKHRVIHFGEGSEVISFYLFDFFFIFLNFFALWRQYFLIFFLSLTK